MRTSAPRPLLTLAPPLTALTLLCVALCAACTTLSSSDDFAPEDDTLSAADTSADTSDTNTPNRAALCAAVCEGLSDCDTASLDAAECTSRCTAGGGEGAQFDCYIDAILADTEDSTDPEDVVYSAEQLCNLLRFNAADARACEDATAQCGVECDLLWSVCQEVAPDTLYATCMNNCVALYDISTSALGVDAKCMKESRIRADKADTTEARAAQCVTASKPCDAGQTCVPIGTAMQQTYQCAQPCAAAEPRCPAGSRCELDYCLPCPDGNCNTNTQIQCGQVQCDATQQACIGGSCYPRAMCGGHQCGAGEACSNVSLCECGGVAGSPGQPACAPNEVCAGGQCLPYNDAACGQRKCNPGEVCVNNACRCGTLTACGAGEYCTEEKCGCGASVNTLPGTEACPTEGQVCAQDRCVIPSPNP